MRLIDADKLYPDSVSIKGDRLCISQSQIANAPTVCDIEQSAILMRKLYEEYEHNLEQIRAEIEKVFCISVITDELRTPMEVKAEILQIIDKHISGDMRGAE